MISLNMDAWSRSRFVYVGDHGDRRAVVGGKPKVILRHLDERQQCLLLTLTAETR